MYCDNCGNKINLNEKYCTNCGFSQINKNMDLTKNIENKKEDKKKIIKFTLIRTIISVICICLIFSLSIVIEEIEINNNFILIGMILFIIGFYIFLSVILNKFINFNNFSHYILTNVFSILITFIISICASIVYFNIKLSNAGDAGGAVLVVIWIILIGIEVFSYPLILLWI